MSVENTALAENLSNAAPFTTDNSIPDDDASLGALWDQVNRDNGAARGDDGKFTSPNGDEPGDEDDGQANADGQKQPPLEGEGGGEDQGNADSTPVVSSVPLPANWKGPDGKARADLDAIWGKLSAEEQQVLQKHQQELHTRMSDQGRQIGAFKPLQEVMERHKDLYEGKMLPSGEQATPQGAIDLLMNAHRKIQTNPVAGILEVAEMYGVRDHLAAVMQGRVQAPQGAQQHSQQAPHTQPTSLSPAEIKALVQDTFSEVSAVSAAQAEINRLSSDKPLIAEIPEDDMVFSIHKARAKLESLGQTATHEAVFNLAYDMAVHADPDLRARAAALAASANPAKPQATQPDPKKVEGAKRAASVNLTSTASGKARELTEDELLAQAYDAAHSKG